MYSFFFSCFYDLLYIFGFSSLITCLDVVFIVFIPLRFTELLGPID